MRHYRVTPENLVKKTRAAYDALESFQAACTAESGAEDPSAGTGRLLTEASIVLSKPNRYRIVWTTRDRATDSTSSGAVWSDGIQAWIYHSQTGACCRMPDAAAALAAACGISCGTAWNIPASFLTGLTNRQPILALWGRPRIVRSEMLGDEDSYVLTDASGSITWVSKRRSFILRAVRASGTGTRCKVPVETMSEDPAQLVMDMGGASTPANIERIQQLLQRASSCASFPGTPQTRFNIEDYREISSRECSNADFEYSPPAGTVMLESFFDLIVNCDARSQGECQ